jgi:hypothetical protein
LSRSISSRATEFGSYFGSDILGTFFDEARECDRTHRAPRHGKPRSGRRPSERTTFLSHGSTTPILSHRERRRAVSSLLTAFRSRITDCTSWITVYRGALRTAITTPTATYGPKPLGEALVKDEMEREVCWRVCHAGTIKLDDAVDLFADWLNGRLAARQRSVDAIAIGA